LKVVFWDVDTQIDFMEPAGKLYVPGAEEIRLNLASLTNMGLGVLLSGSVDAHMSDDPEFVEWPEHCVYGTPGQLKIQDSLVEDILFVPSAKLSSEQLAEVAAFDGQVIFEKQDTDVSSNPNVKPFVDLIEPDLVVVYGVVTEICVNLTVNFLAGDLGYGTVVVVDAVKELDSSEAVSCQADWKAHGVKVVNTSSVYSMLGNLV
jgi:nicotinamidase/pyrazinamidase